MRQQIPSSPLVPFLVVGALAVPALFATSVQAHMRGMYASKAAAEKRAAELKCKGTFAVSVHGG